MAQTTFVRVSGRLACFTRPEAKVERYSYDIMTPSAARGVLDSIMWKPEMRWIIRSIRVLSPIKFITLKRNEVQSKIPIKGKTGLVACARDPSRYKPMPAGAGSSEATPRSTTALRDVDYVIEAEPLVYDPKGGNNQTKYIEMFERRVRKGQCHIRPCLGCREFAAEFAPLIGDEKTIDETRDLGLMLYDVAFDSKCKNNIPVFFRARLEKGVLDTRPDKAITDEKLRKEVLECSCKR